MNKDRIKKNWGKTAVQLFDMLQRARHGWEEQNVHPNWIGKKIFDELLVY